MRTAGVAIGLLVLLGVLAGTGSEGLGPAIAHGQGGGDCLSADPPPLSSPARRVSFGITPLAAGTAGGAQSQPKPADPAAELRELALLRPQRRQLVMRLNRMFWSDGINGIRRYAAIVDRYARAGFDSELQVRYHPPEGAAGNMEAWRKYVEAAARILGKRPAVKALSITNEANFSASPNTSDGSYAGVREAIVAGTIAARRELDRIGRGDVELGFSFAWRYLPNSDLAFWQQLGTMGNAEFRRAVDYVGLQVYPHLVWPPAPLPDRSAGDEVIEALTLLRNCFMPKAGLGPGVELWVSENGYATNLGRTEAGQDASLASTLESVHRYSGTLGVTDYRWFNLRDNNSLGPDLFDAVGVLRDDYSEKPAFGTLRGGIASFGADRPRRRRCGGRIATTVGTGKRDVLIGTPGPDEIVGGGGRDVIKGGGGNDRLCGGAGPDTIKGGSGKDRVRGGRGRDRCQGERGTC